MLGGLSEFVSPCGILVVCPFVSLLRLFQYCCDYFKGEVCLSSVSVCASLLHLDADGTISGMFHGMVCFHSILAHLVLSFLFSQDSTVAWVRNGVLEQGCV